jgi:farnesyl-diphosphate farnesyltransferase
MMAPANIASRVMEATATMATRMAHWVKGDFVIRTEEDLDTYCFDVAGQVGLLLTDIWAWDTGTRASRENAVGFGRGLQAVNIVRNRDEDLARGVDFWPDGWTLSDMIAYVHKQLGMADLYIEELPVGSAQDFCRIPLALAYGTMEAIEAGREKLTRGEVETLIASCTEG